MSGAESVRRGTTNHRTQRFGPKVIWDEVPNCPKGFGGSDLEPLWVLTAGTEFDGKSV